MATDFPTLSAQDLAIVESTPIDQNIDLNRTFVDERGNPITDPGEIKRKNAEHIANTTRQDKPAKMEPPQYVDAMGLYNDGLLTKDLLPVMKNNQILFLEDEESLFGKMGNQFKDREGFDQFYSGIADYVDTLNQLNKSVKFYEHRRPLLMYGGYEPPTSDVGLSIKGDSNLKYGSQILGYPTIFSDEGLASMSGKYRTKDPISGEWMEKDMGWWDKLTANIKLSYDDKGNPFWEEAPYGRMYGHQQLYSIFGPQRPWANPIYSYPVKFVTAATTELAAGAGYLTGLMNFGMRRLLGMSEEDILKNADQTTVSGAAANYLTPLAPFTTNPSNIWALSNWLEKWTYKPTERSRDTRWQELMNPFHSQNNFEDFGFFLTELIGMLMPQRSIPWMVSKGAKNLAKKLAPSVANRLIAGESATVGRAVLAGTKGIGKTIPEIEKIAYDFALRQTMPHNYVMRSMTMGIGTVQALSAGWIKHAVDEGIPLDKMALWTIAAAPAVAATEWLTSGWLAKGLGNRPDKELIREASGNFWSKYTKNLPKAELGKRAANTKMMRGYVDWAIKGGLYAKGMPVVKGAVHEGFQEGMEEVWYDSLRWAYNEIYDGNPEAGRFKQYAGSEGFWDRIFANVVGGAWGGGLFDGMINIVSKRNTHDYTVDDVLRSGGKNAERTIKYIFNNKIGEGVEHDVKGNLHNGTPPSTGNTINQNGEFDAYGIPRNYEVKTLHDQWVHQLIEKVEIEKHWANVFQLNSLHLKDMFMKDLRFADETMELVFETRKTHDEITKMESDYAQTDDVATKETLEGNIKQLKDKYQDQLTKVKESTTPLPGKKYSQRFYDFLIDRAVVFKNKILTPKALEGLEMFQRSVEIYQSLLDEHKAYIEKREKHRTNFVENLTKDFEVYQAAINKGDITEIVKSLDDISNQVTQATDLDLTTLSPEAQKKLNEASENLLGIISENKVQLQGMPVGQYIDSAYKNAETAISDIETQAQNLTDSITEETTPEQLAAIEEEIAQVRGLIPMFQMAGRYDQFIEKKKVDDSFLMYFADKVSARLAETAANKRNADPKNKGTEVKAEDLEYRSLREEIRLLNSIKDEINNANATNALLNIKATVEIKKMIADTLLAAQMVDKELGEDVSQLDAKFALTQADVDQISKHVDELLEGFTEGENTYMGINELYALSKANTGERIAREKTRRVNSMVHYVHSISMLSDVKDFFSEKLADDMREFATEIKDLIHQKKRIFDDAELTVIEKKIADFKARAYNELGTAEKRQKFLKAYGREVMKFVLTGYTGTIGIGYTHPHSTIYLTTEKFLATEPYDFADTIENGKVIQNDDGTRNKLKQKAYLNHYVLMQMNFANELAMFNANDINKLMAESLAKSEYVPSIEQHQALTTVMSYLLGDIDFFAYTAGISQSKASDAAKAKIKQYSKNSITLQAASNNKNYSFNVGFPINGLILPGIGGSGKTTILPGLIFNMLNNYLGKNKGVAKVLVVAITGDMRKAITEQGKGMDNIHIDSKDYASFLKDYHTLQDQYDFIMIDEASRLSLTNVQSIYGSQKSNTAKMLFLLDPLQATNTGPTVSGEYLPITNYAARTNQIEEAFRTGNYQIWQVQSITAEALSTQGITDEVVSIPMPTIAKHTSDRRQGLYYASNQKELFSLWYEDVQKGESRYLIVESINDKYKLHKEVDAQYHQYIVYVNDYYISPDIKTNPNDETVQGKTLPFVYVYFNIRESGEKMERTDNIRNFRTAAGRAKSFLAIINTSPNKSNFEVTAEQINDETEALSPEAFAFIQEKLSGLSTDEYSKSFDELHIGKPVVIKKARERKKKDEGRKKPEKAKGDKKQPSVIKPVDDTRLKFKKNESIKLKDGNGYFDLDPNASYIIRDIYNEDNKNYVNLVSEDGLNVIEGVLYSDIRKNFEHTGTDITKTEVDEVTEDGTIDQVEKGTRAIDIWAARYSNTGLFPASMAIMSGDTGVITNYFKRAIADKADILRKNHIGSGRNLKLVFHKEINLYTPPNESETQSSEKHFNVITVETAKGEIIATLYQPLASEAEFQKYQKNLLRVSQINKTRYPEMKWDQATQRDIYTYNNALRNLYQKGLNTIGNETKITLGEFRISKIQGGMAITSHEPKDAKVFYSEDPNNPGLYQEVIEKGGKWKTHADGSIVIEWKKDFLNSEYMNYYAYMTYLDGATYVPVEIKGVRFADMKQPGKKVSDVEKHFRNSVAELKKAIQENDQSVVNEIVNRSLLKNSLNFNRRLIDKVSPIQDAIVADSHGYDIISSVKGKYDQETLLRNIDKAAGWLVEQGYSNMARRGEYGDESVIPINTNELKKTGMLNQLKTSVQEVRMPHITGKIVENTLNKSDDQSNPFAGWPSLGTMPKEFGMYSPPSMEMGGFEYGNKVLGKSFMDGNLILQPNVQLHGAALYGYVHEFFMILEGNPGATDIELFKMQHEAVHYALKHLVSPQTRTEILAAVIEQVARERGYELTEAQAEEYLAEINRGAIEFKQQFEGITGKIKQFLNWLSETIFNVRLFGNDAQKFLYRLNAGHFRNAKPIYNNYPSPAAMQKISNITDIQVLDTLSRELKIIGEDARARLLQVFKSESRLNSVILDIQNRGHYFSRINGRIDDHDGTPAEGALAFRQAVLNQMGDRRQAFFGNVEIDMKYLDVKSYADFLKMGHDDIEKAYQVYRNTKLLDEQVLTDVINLAFQEIVTDSERTDTLAHSRKYTDLDISITADHATKFVKSWVRTIKLMEFEQNGVIFNVKTVPASNTPVYIDDNKFLRLMTQVNNFARNQQDKYPGLSYDEMLMQSVYVNALKYSMDGDSETANTLMSFYYHIKGLDGSPKVTAEQIKGSSGEMKYTLRSFVDDPLGILPGDNIAAKKKLLQSNTKYAKKIQAHNELYNSIMSLMGSIYLVETSTLEQQEGRIGRHYAVKVSNNTNISALKTALKEQIKSRLNPDGPYKTNLYDQLTHIPKKASDTPKGAWIMTEANKADRLMYGQNPNPLFIIQPTGKFEFQSGHWLQNEENKNNLKKMFNVMLSDFGIYVKDSVVNAIMRNKDGFSTEQLAQFIADAYTIVINGVNEYYLYVESDIAENKKDMPESFKQRIEKAKKFPKVYKKIYKELVKKYEKIADRLDEHSDMSEPGSIMHVTDLVDPLDNIADAIAHIEYLTSKGWNYTATGERYNPTLLTQPMLEKYNMGYETPAETSNVIRKSVNDQFSNLTEEQKKQIPLFYDLVISGKMSVAINMNTGLGNKYNKVKQTQMVPRDRAKAGLDLFTNSFKTKKVWQIFDVFPGNFGDSSAVYTAKVQFFTNDKDKQLFHLIFKDNLIDDIKMNHAAINELLGDLIQQEYVIRENAIRMIMDSNLFSFTQNEKEALLKENKTEDEERQAADILQNTITTKKASKEFLQELNKTDLIQDVHYIITDRNNIIPGNALNSALFHWSLYHKWNSAKTEKQKNILRRGYFNDRFKTMAVDLSKLEAKPPKHITDTFGNQYYDTTVGKDGLEYWNPFYEAYLYTHFFASHHFGTFNVGSHAHFREVDQYVKRSKTAVVAGQKPVIGNNYGIQRNGVYVLVKDSEIRWPGLTALFGSRDTAEVTDGQRYSNPIGWKQYATSLGGNMSIVKMGDPGAKSVWGYVDNTDLSGHFIKSATININNDNYRANKDLYNSLMMFYLAPVQDKIVYDEREMTLLEIYNEQEKQVTDNNIDSVITLLHQLISIERMSNPGFASEMIMGVMNKSTVKIPMKNQNQYTYDELLDIVQQGTTDDIIATVLDQTNDFVQNNPIFTETTVAKLSQLNKQMFINPNNIDRANALKRIDHAQALKQYDRLVKQLEKNGYEGMLRETGKNMAKNMSHSAFLHEILRNPRISPLIANIHRLVSASLVERFSEGITYHTTGKELLQRHDRGWYETIYLQRQEKRKGTVIRTHTIAVTKAEYEQHMKDASTNKRSFYYGYTPVTDTEGKISRKGLRRTLLLDENGVDITEQADADTEFVKLYSEKERLRKEILSLRGDARAEKLLRDTEDIYTRVVRDYNAKRSEYLSRVKRIIPHEVVMEFQHAEEFGFNRMNRPSLSKVLNLRFDYNGTVDIVNVREWLRSNTEGLSRNQAIVALANYFKEEVQDISEEMKSRLSYMSEQSFISELAQTEFIDLKTGNELDPRKVASYYYDLYKALQVVIARRPTADWSNVSAAEIAEINYETPGIIVTSGFHMLLDGSDNDGDHLVILHRHLYKNEETQNIVIPYPANHSDGALKRSDNRQLDNARFDLYYDTFTDPKNVETYMDAVKHAEMIELGEIFGAEDKTKAFFYDLTTEAKQYNAAHISERLIGFSATASNIDNMLKGFTKAQWAELLPGFKYHDGNIKTDQYGNRISIASILGTYMQTLLEDTKNLVVADLNLNMATAPLFIALAESDLSIRESLEFLHDPDIKSITDVVYNSMSVDQQEVSLYDVTVRKIDYYDALLEKNREGLNERYKLFISNLKNKIKKYEEALTSSDTSPEIIKSYITEHSNRPTIEQALEEVYYQELTYQDRIDINSYKKLRETLTNKLNAMRNELRIFEQGVKESPLKGEELYLNNIEHKYNELLKKLVLLKEFAIKSDALIRLNLAVKLGKDFPKSDYEYYAFVRNLRNYSRVNDIEGFLDGHVSQTPEMTSQIIEEYSRYYDRGESKTGYFYDASQKTVNDFMISIMGRLQKRMIDDLPVNHPGKKIKFFTNADSGISEAFIEATKPYNSELEVFMPGKNGFNDFLYRSGYGNNIYGEMAKERIDGLLKGSNAKLKQSGKASYHENVEAIIADKRVNMVIVFAPYDTFEVSLARNYANKYKKELLVMDAANFELIGEKTKSEMANHVDKQLRDYVDGTLKKTILKESVKQQKQFGIAIFGTNLYGMNRAANKSDYEIQIQKEKEIDKNINVGEIMRQDMTHNISLKTLMLLYNAMSGELLALQPKTQEYLRAIEHNQLRPVLTQSEYIETQKQLNNAVNFEIAKRIMKNRVIDIDHPNTKFGDRSDSAAKNITLQSNDTSQVDYYLLEFPEYVMHLKRTEMRDHPFFEHLEISNQNLVMDNVDQLTQNDVNNLMLRFDELSEDFQFKLLMYDLLHYGLNDNHMRQFMGPRLLEMISEHYRDIISESTDIESEFWKKADENFVINALVQSERLGRELNKKKKKANVFVQVENVETPEYYKDTKKIRFYRTAKFLNTIQHDDQGNFKGIKSVEVNPVVGMRPAILPLVKSYTKKDVIRITDVEQARRLMNGIYGDKRFNYAHNYKKGSKVIVMGRQGTISNVGNVWINLYAYTGNQESRPLNNTIEGFNMNTEKVSRFIGVLQDKLPWLGITTVTNETTHRPGRMGYVHNGKVYYNLDLIRPDTFLHEIIHPFIVMASESDIEAVRTFYDLLMEKVNNEIESDTELVKSIREAYPDLSGEDFSYEVASTILGLASEENVANYINYEPETYYQQIKNFVSEMWNRIKSFFNELIFGLKGIPRTMSISQIGPENTLKEFAEAMYKDIFTGKMNKLFTYMDQSMINPITVNADSLPIKNIRGYRDLQSAILFNGENYNVEELKMETNVNALYMELQHRDEKQMYGVPIAIEWATGDEQTIKDAIKNKIIVNRSSYLNKFKDGFEEWLNIDNDAAPHSAADINKFMSSDIINNYGENMFWRTYNVLNIGQDTRIHSYKSLQNHSNPTFKAMYNKDFDDGHMYLVVNNEYKNDSNETIYDINFVNINFEGVQYANQQFENSFISRPWVTDKAANRLGITMINNYGSVRNLNMMFALMYMADNVNMKNLNLLTFGSIYMDNQDKQPHFVAINIKNTLQNIDGLSRIEPFTQMLDGYLAKLFGSKELKNAKLYEPDYMSALMNFWDSQRRFDEIKSEKGHNDYESMYASKHRDRIQHAFKTWITERGSRRTLLDLVNRHMEYITRRDKFSERNLPHSEIKAYNTEYRLLNNVATDIEKLIKVENDRTQSFINLMTAPTYDAESNILQNVYTLATSKMSEISGVYLKFVEALNQQIEVVNKKYREENSIFKSYFIDDSPQRFKPLLIDTIYEDGKMIKKGYKDMEIHHDETDPRTKYALHVEKTIDENMLEVGKWIVKNTNIFMKQILRQHYLHKAEALGLIKDDLSIDKEAIEKRVEMTFKERWKPGYLPVMRMQASEAFAQLKIKEAYDRILYQAKNPNLVFEEVAKLGNEADTSDGIHSMFYNQITEDADRGIGTSRRHVLLGIGLGSDGRYKLVNQEENDGVTQNVAMVLRYLAMDAIAKPIIENDVMPLIDRWRTLATTMSKLDGKDMNAVIDGMDLFEQKTLKGRHKALSSKHINDKTLKGLEGYLRLGLRVTTFAGVALSVPVAVLSISANATEAITEAIANSLYPGAHDIFTMGSLRKAVAEWTVNREKVNNIANKYQVYESERWDALNHIKYQKEQDHIYAASKVHFMNRITDIEARKIIAIAVMIHDGSFYAHNENADYDVKLDRRYWNSDGTQTEEQQELQRWLVDDLRDDYRYAEEQAGKDEPIVAYSSVEIEKLQFAGTEFVIGVYDKQHTPQGDNYLAYDVVMQFKKFVTAKFWNRYGKMTATTGHQIRKVQLENGEVVRDVDGHAVRYWKQMHKEGTYRTTARVLKNMLAHVPGVSDILDSYHLINKERSLEEWANMTDLEKRNLWRAAMDLAAFSASYMLFTGLAGLAPDDVDPEKYAYHRARQLRLIDSIRRGMLTAIAATPYQMMDMLTQIPMVDQVKRLFKVVTLDEPWRNGQLLLPGRSTVVSIKETIDFALEE